MPLPNVVNLYSVKRPSPSLYEALRASFGEINLPSIHFTLSTFNFNKMNKRQDVSPAFVVHFVAFISFFTRFMRAFEGRGASPVAARCQRTAHWSDSPG